MKICIGDSFRNGEYYKGKSKMIKVKIDKSTYLVVDFEGLLSPREEEITAYRFAGKNKVAISQICGTKPDTVNKQQRSIFKKTAVDGNDNPLALLMCKSFQNGWAKFAVFTLIFCSLTPAVRCNVRCRPPSVSARRCNEFDLASGTV